MDAIDQAHIAGEAKEVVDLVVLAPGQQFLAGKSTIGAQQDLISGQRCPIWATMRATSSLAPAKQSIRSLIRTHDAPGLVRDQD